METHALNNLRRLILTTDFCKQRTAFVSEVKFQILNVLFLYVFSIDALFDFSFKREFWKLILLEIFYLLYQYIQVLSTLIVTSFFILFSPVFHLSTYRRSNSTLRTAAKYGPLINVRGGLSFLSGKAEERESASHIKFFFFQKFCTDKPFLNLVSNDRWWFFFIFERLFIP